MGTNHLVIIDGQNDFCLKDGALSVPGGLEDMQRVAKMIGKNPGFWDDISITMDSHHQLHIANPPFWRNTKGLHPTPYLNISEEMVIQGEWFPTHPEHRRIGRAYVHQLAVNGRYELTIWPPHCLIGTTGTAVVTDLMNALLAWEAEYASMVNKVAKGSNLYTEHYSAVQADVPNADLSTHLNTSFIEMVSEYDNIYVCGEASSHCLKFTVEDIANNFGDESYVNKLVLIEDACSPVGLPVFEKQAEDFVRTMKARGMRTTTTRELMAA